MKALALALALYCPLPLAQEPERIRCSDGWCVMSEPMLRQIVATIEQLTKHSQELRELCGWEGQR